MNFDELVVLADGQRMGRLLRHRERNTLGFDYEATWLASAAAYPLSVSMPLLAQSHAHAVVEPFLWGLLPDNDEVLRRWGERFGVSPHNAFKLIAHVGEDCAGAVQFVPQERESALRGTARRGRIDWIDERQVSERVALLLRDHAATRLGADAGRFSLAGAQPKTALFHDPESDRWGVPSGATPTTHILKPSTGRFDGFAENEHFCTALARTLGLPAATSTIRRFGATPVFVTERYDRLRQGRRVVRVHQEDLCQALARPPQAKYQNEGGPSAAEVMAVIRAHSSAARDDALRFVDALLFNWLILGTDAHAKNYSLLLGARGSVRLAPLYDLASVLPYPEQLPLRRVTLAMKVGGEYRARAIIAQRWRTAAHELTQDADAVRARMSALAAALPDAASDVRRRMQQEGVTHPVLARLVAALAERAEMAREMAAKVWR